MEFYVKNMVCDRCIMVVKDDFTNAGIQVQTIDLGKVTTTNEVTTTQKATLKTVLEAHGFQLLKSEDEITSDRLKTEMLQFLVNANLQNEKLSEHLATTLGKEYGVLSKQFSKYNSITIEKYFIKLKIEKAKQYIQEQHLNFSEIADVLGYNSLSHLSTQFKKETGNSLSQFKAHPQLQRNSLDKIL